MVIKALTPDRHLPEIEKFQQDGMMKACESLLILIRQSYYLIIHRTMYTIDPAGDGQGHSAWFAEFLDEDAEPQ